MDPLANPETGRVHKIQPVPEGEPRNPESCGCPNGYTPFCETVDGVEVPLLDYCYESNGLYFWDEPARAEVGCVDFAGEWWPGLQVYCVPL